MVGVAGRRVIVGVGEAAGATHSVISPDEVVMTTLSPPTCKSRPRPSISSFCRYSPWLPPGCSMTAYNWSAFTATPARRNPAGADTAVGEAVTVDCGVRLGNGVTPATDGAIRSDIRWESHRPTMIAKAVNIPATKVPRRCAITVLPS